MQYVCIKILPHWPKGRCIDLRHEISKIRVELFSYLNSGFSQADSHGQLLPHEDVRIMSLGERPLELVQLRRREPRPMPFLLQAVAVATAVVVHVGCSGRCGSFGGLDISLGHWWMQSEICWTKTYVPIWSNLLFTFVVGNRFMMALPLFISQVHF